MSSLQSLLAGGIVEQLPKYSLIGSLVLIALAFIYGAWRGMRKVGWGAFYWALAAVAFIFSYRLLGAMNPYASILTERWANAAGVLWTFTLAAACVLVSLILYGLFGAIFRPCEGWVKNYEVDEYGFEYELEDMDDNPVHPRERGRKLVMKGDGKPGILARLGGGLMSAFNMAAILAVIAVLVVMIVGGTKLGTGAMGDIFKSKLGQDAALYTSIYALDFITIGIVVGIAYKGYKVGFIGSARTVLLTIGIIGAIGVCFAVPFLAKFAENYYVSRLIARCTGLYSKLQPATLGNILGKLTAGGLMAVVAVAIILIVTFLLKLLENAVANTTVIRVIDGILSAVLFLALGILVCAIFWGGLYTLEYCGVFKISDVLDSRAIFAKESFAACEEFLKPFIDRILSKIQA